MSRSKVNLNCKEKNKLKSKRKSIKLWKEWSKERVISYEGLLLWKICDYLLLSKNDKRDGH